MLKFADINLFDYAALHQYGVSQLILIGIAKMMTATAATVYAQGSWQLTINFSNVPFGWNSIFADVYRPFGNSYDDVVTNSVNPFAQFTLSNDQFPPGDNLKICVSELRVEPTPCDIVVANGNDFTYNWDFNTNHQCQSPDPSSCSPHSPNSSYNSSQPATQPAGNDESPGFSCGSACNVTPQSPYYDPTVPSIPGVNP